MCGMCTLPKTIIATRKVPNPMVAQMVACRCVQQLRRSSPTVLKSSFAHSGQIRYSYHQVPPHLPTPPHATTAAAIYS